MKTITREQYLQLVGLLALAKRHNELLKELVVSVAAIVGEPKEDGYYGHSSDAVYSDYDADDLLKRLDVTVEPPAPML